MQNETTERRQYVPAVGPKLHKLLMVVFGMFALLAINSVYLAGITLAEWFSAATYQDYFYQWMFLAHLVLGLIIVLPVIVYGIVHIKNARHRPNRRAIKVGYALFAFALVLLASGLILTRGLPYLEVRDPAAREMAYWVHVIVPLLVVWLFILHRLAGKGINWKAGGAVTLVAVSFALVMLGIQSQDPRLWNVVGPASGEQYFFPSLSRTATGNFIPAKAMMMDSYCKDCHIDAHRGWEMSMHHLSSFNNPVYLFSVRNTREFAMQRDGTVQGSRFCAGCHDPVPFFSGAFDDPDFDDVNHPTAQAGITCTSCHAITHINSPRGNADYTIEEPIHYPFAYSDDPLLAWVNRMLVKAKPEFHKKTFLKPLHKTAEFCGTCHKVHLPVELNGYRWLRGQNSYDSFLLSGVSGHGAASFYYPDQAVTTCNQCHMPWQVSDDFAAIPDPVSGEFRIHDHQFPSANTAIPQIVGMPDWVNAAHRKFLEGSLRLDLFGLRRGGAISGELIAPLRPDIPALVPGESYLLETVLRTLTLGHLFTQGTADSNQVWVEITVSAGDRLIGRSGAVNDLGEVDPWSWFGNAYVVDREGRRIDRRNPEDIFVSLYNHQIPPGAGEVVHYRFTVPEDIGGPVTVRAALKYRKFDTTMMRLVLDDTRAVNDLPVVTIATDSITFPVYNQAESAAQVPDIPEWQRWNDYGIGLLRTPGAGELRQAEEAFRMVENLGRADGPLNLARVYLREGRLDEAVVMLERAARYEPAAYPWVVAWFTGQVNRQNGFLDEAIENFRNILDTRYQLARDRGFDFSLDYRVSNMLAQTLFERAQLERGDGRREKRNSFIAEAIAWYRHTLGIEPENAEAYYGLSQAYAQSGETGLSEEHRRLYQTYKVDDNARDRAIALARRMDPAANHAANPVAIYDLQRESVTTGPVFDSAPD
ncbi:MAG: hypothetical protein IIA05_03720 [Proteobacteria bacterium]|nr:hypothetical protein [Pseudomonadota bacterium]